MSVRCRVLYSGGYGNLLRSFHPPHKASVDTERPRPRMAAQRRRGPVTISFVCCRLLRNILLSTELDIKSRLHAYLKPRMLSSQPWTEVSIHSAIFLPPCHIQICKPDIMPPDTEPCHTLPIHPTLISVILAHASRHHVTLATLATRLLPDPDTKPSQSQNSAFPAVDRSQLQQRPTPHHLVQYRYKFRPYTTMPPS